MIGRAPSSASFLSISQSGRGSEEPNFVKSSQPEQRGGGLTVQSIRILPERDFSDRIERVIFMRSRRGGAGRAVRRTAVRV